MPHPAISLLIAAAAVGLLALLAWPRRGVFARLQWMRRLGQRACVEDALKHLHHCEFHGQPATLERLAATLEMGRHRAAALVSRLESLGLLVRSAGALRLTEEGRRDALRIVRVHRLLEKYLAERTGLSEFDWHAEADHREHYLSDADVAHLAEELGHPRFDPHGDPIPTEAGDIPRLHGRPLVELPQGSMLSVTHVEDEPAAAYAELTARGMAAGTQVRLLDVAADHVRVEIEGVEHALSPAAAASVTAAVAAEERRAVVPTGRLSDLRDGEAAQVVGIAPACRGLQRRRLLDLGLVPGTLVAPEIRAPSGDPVGYRIRGAVIALRRQQADWILVAPAASGNGN